MGATFVVIGLRRKYAELKGRIRYTADCWDEPTLDALRQVGNVLRLFSPGEDLAAIKPLRPYKGARAKHWTRTALDVLRTANGPLTGREIARRVAKVHGVADRETLYSIEASLHITLPKRAGVAMVGTRPKRWGVEG
jgi:hypothetical protein